MNYFNKDLDDIGFQTIEPSAALEPYIYNYWIVRKQNLNKPITNKILSDGSSGFILNFSSPYVIELNKKKILCDEKFIYTGPTKHPTLITFENSLYAIGIRFKAAGAYAFFGKMSDLKDSVIKQDDNVSWKINKLYEKVQGTQPIEEKISHIEDFLLDKLKNSKKKNSIWIFDFIQAVLSHKGDVNIEQLCSHFKIGKRHCERRFKEEVGLTPKAYAQIIRMRNVRDTLSSLKVSSLTSIGYDNGFFDQAHFIHEFKSFMHETPKNYFTKKQEMAKSLNYKTYMK